MKWKPWERSSITQALTVLEGETGRRVHFITETSSLSRYWISQLQVHKDLEMGKKKIRPHCQRHSVQKALVTNSLEAWNWSLAAVSPKALSDMLFRLEKKENSWLKRLCGNKSTTFQWSILNSPGQLRLLAFQPPHNANWTVWIYSRTEITTFGPPLLLLIGKALMRSVKLAPVPPTGIWAQHWHYTNKLWEKSTQWEPRIATMPLAVATITEGLCHIAFENAPQVVF